MPTLYLFRSAVLDAKDMPMTKAILCGDVIAKANHEAFEKWLQSPDDHVLALGEDVRVMWLN